MQHTFQTNGILLDDEWCAFFKANNDFLVGLSVDGPRELHDAYRLDRGGRGTFDRVMQGWRQLRQHGVDFNILCTVNAANQTHGRAVYRFFRDELARHVGAVHPDRRARHCGDAPDRQPRLGRSTGQQTPALHADRRTW